MAIEKKTEASEVPKKLPKYSVSTPRDYEVEGEKKTFWTNIGRASDTEQGLMVWLDALPVNGKIFIKENAQASQ